MEDRNRAIIDIGEAVADMSYPELSAAALELRRCRFLPAEMAAICGLYMQRAKALGMGREFGEVLRAMKPQRDPPLIDDWPLQLDRHGRPLCTVENIACILEHDANFLGVRFNELLGAPEVEALGRVRRWTDTDVAMATQILEADYGLYSPQKLQNALRLLFRRRKMHPIRELFETLEWDGESRLEAFLPRWMGCDDTPYIREVSRLIFAGGVRRLFEPGCKFDTVPVLTGAQGSGKSTIVRWLAMKDEWFAEVTEMEGRESIEQLSGAWICEIAELLALTRVKEQEAVKSFLSRQRDRCRKPYDREVTELPRQCIFIGTTNRPQFLRDRTGNRRFCPVPVKSRGADLFAEEAACREYIRQCWAEAYALYRDGKLPATASPALFGDFLTAQADAMEDDWRVGAIRNYMGLVGEDYPLCVRDVARNALVLGDDRPRDPTQQESREIAAILDAIPELERAGRTRLPNYGMQLVWRRKESL